MNPFLALSNPDAWGPGSLEMALPLVQAVSVAPGMRILEVGGGSGQIAATIARHWEAQVVTLEPWTDGKEILACAAEQGVANRVLPLRVKAQAMPFADAGFDAVISIGSFEMIGNERPAALQEMIRVARPGARIGIAEPMVLEPMPADLDRLHDQAGLGFKECFRTLDWNRELFESHGLTVVEAYHFPQAYQWWLDYQAKGRIGAAEQEFIRQDQGRWITLGLVVGEKRQAGALERPL